MTQAGTVVAIRRGRVDNGRSLGNARHNGISVSPDGTTIMARRGWWTPGMRP